MNLENTLKEKEHKLAFVTFPPLIFVIYMWGQIQITRIEVLQRGQNFLLGKTHLLALENLRLTMAF